jgi:putative ABC transport system substrate-binding protein
MLLDARQICSARLRRRDFMALLLGATAACPLGAHAQQRSGTSKVGVLWHAANAEEEGPLFKGLLEGFRALGYVEGRNISLEHRFPNEIAERFKSMASELVALNLDALVGAGTQAALALRDATKKIPIVFMFSPDPVGTKLVDSLSRPGGNVTGLSNFSSDLIGKRLQLLKEAIPRLSRVALLVNPDSQISRRYIESAQTAAPALGLTIRTFEVRLLDEFQPAFDAMAKASMQAVSINADGLIYQRKEMIAKLALARRMALVAYSRETFEAGALMSYGPDNVQATHRAAALVDKILKGVKPGELPVEQPTKFELGINLGAAKTLGLTIPQSVLARADDVIE